MVFGFAGGLLLACADARVPMTVADTPIHRSLANFIVAMRVK
jgi:hypothetical protein